MKTLLSHVSKGKQIVPTLSEGFPVYGMIWCVGCNGHSVQFWSDSWLPSTIVLKEFLPPELAQQLQDVPMSQYSTENGQWNIRQYRPLLPAWWRAKFLGFHPLGTRLEVIWLCGLYLRMVCSPRSRPMSHSKDNTWWVIILERYLELGGSTTNEVSSLDGFKWWFEDKQ